MTAAPGGPPTLIALTGYRGSGKTTVAKLLHARLGAPWRLVDLDAEIQADAGRSIAAIFESDGEARFRDLETATLARVLDAAMSDKTPVLLALGGGTVTERPENLERLHSANARTVYLACEPAELARRIRADAATAEQRPGLTRTDTDPAAEVATVLARRDPLYRSAADHTLDVSRITPAEAADVLMQLLVPTHR